MTLARVLVVDDNLANLKLLAFLLKGRGFEVDVAIHAEEALERLAVTRPDLILMDIQLPGMDGLTLTRKLKADPRTRDIHIVAVTAYAMKGDEATALDAGCDDYITKPIDTRTLPERLSRILSREHGTPTAPAPSPATAPTAKSTATLTNRPVILVVEDNAITRRMVRFALERADFAVVEAKSGEEALQAFRAHEVALVLQDLGLGDMDGFELVKRLRASPRGHETPILVFSGLLSTHDTGRITSAGFDDMVMKPVEPSRLVQIVRTHLPDSHAPTDAFGHGLRLIVVDDDPVQRRLVAFRMGREGFAVQLASDGEEALAHARLSPPDAIVSDVLMPRLDGFGLCLAASRDPALCEVPIILATNSYIEPVDRELALRLGARDLVLRTPDLRDVLEVLRSNLGVSASNTASGTRPGSTTGAAHWRPGDKTALVDSETGPPQPPHPSQTGELVPVNQDHAQRIAAQLEKHVALNTRMSQRSALLSAEVLVIRGISEALASHEDIDTALSMAIAACFDAGQALLGGLLLVDARGARVLTTHGVDGAGARELESFLLTPELEDSLASRSILFREGDPAPAIARLLESASANCGILVPLAYKNRRFGALFMLCRLEESELAERTTFVEAVAAQVSQALAVAESFDERARSERRAIEQSTLLGSILDSLADGVIVVDADGAVTRVNDAGRPLAELLSGPERGLFMADRVTALSLETSPLGRAMRGEAVDGAEVFAQLGGEARWYAVSARPWRRDSHREGGEDVRCGAVSIFRDVTREKATQSHLMTSDRMASVGLLAAGVAHEINNPLASVLTNLEVARKDTLPRALAGDPGAGRELVEILADAREAAERVHHIVRDLKIFSRHEEVVDGVSDIHAVLESTLRMANNEIRHRARLVKELCPVAHVEGSESRLGQVFLNLIVNAAQAIPEGNASTHTLTVRTHQEGERVLVSVSDTGIGMGPDALRRLFLPFYTTKGPGVGTGLGLAISHSIVRSLGGEIKVESEPGKGTTFTVSLKVSHVVKRAPTPSATGTNKDPSERGRVLVVDDEPLIGLSIKRLLARTHDVLPLTSAMEALEVLRTERFDVILCDLMMPQVTGMDLYAALETELPELASQVVFLTGGAFTPAARAFLDRVPNTRLNKPFASSELKAIIDERVAANRAAASA